MKSSPPIAKNRFDVFDFSKDDELVEKDSSKLLSKYFKFKPKLRKTSPLTKYSFLQTFARGDKFKSNGDSIELIDLDKVLEGAKPRQGPFSNKPIDVDDGGVAQGDNSRQTVTASESMETDNQGSKTHQEITDKFKDNANVGKSTLSSREHEAFLSSSDTFLQTNSLNSENEQVGISLENDDCVEMRSSTSCFASSEDKREEVAECTFGGSGIDTESKTVVVSPDYILYKDTYCTMCQLTFSCSSIQVKSSTVNGIVGTFYLELAIGQIIKIESKWYAEVESAETYLTFKSGLCTGAESASEDSGTEQLRFKVYNPHWSKVEEAIKSLDVRYKDIWHYNLVDEENATSGQKSLSFSEEYLLEFNEPFEDVVYPIGDPDAVVVSKRDLELLRPHAFINDTIIDFYIKYLKNSIQPEEQHRFHFFNCFFFRKLADLDRDQYGVSEGKEAFQRVRKWTRKVNIFEKDYIFIPINYSFHWSLIVICHPGEVMSCKDDDIEKLPKAPCILHMDSISGSHRGLQNLFQSYLCEEWKEKHRDLEDDASLKFSSLRFLSLELPQQENSFDCGLFLLHYVECFLREALNFSLLKISEYSNFCFFVSCPLLREFYSYQGQGFMLNKDWFPPWEASQKRADIKKLFYEICESQLQKDSSTASDDYTSSQLSSDTNGQEAEYEFSSQNLRPQGLFSPVGNQPQLSTTPPVYHGGDQLRQEPAWLNRSITKLVEEPEESNDIANPPSEVEDTPHMYVMEAKIIPSLDSEQLSMDLEEQHTFVSQYENLTVSKLDEDQPSAECEYEGSDNQIYVVEDSEEEEDDGSDSQIYVVEDSEDEEDDAVVAFLIDNSQGDDMQVDRQRMSSPSPP